MTAFAGSLHPIERRRDLITWSLAVWALSACGCLAFADPLDVLFVAIGAPIVEEVVFRDLVWEVSVRILAPRTVLLATSLVFAAAHAPRAINLGLPGLPLLLGYLAAGLGFGAARARVGLSAAMAAHGISNALFLGLVHLRLWPWG